MVQNSEKKRLISNFSSLSAMQLALMVLPLIAVPYVVRVVGVEKFGVLAMAMSFAMILGVIGDFGILLHAPAVISRSRGDRPEIARKFWMILKFRLATLLPVLMAGSVLIITVPMFRSHWHIFSISMLYSFSYLLFPNWFLQGIEEMGKIAIVNVSSRAVGVLMLFLFVKKPSDYWIVPLLQGGFPLIGAITCVVYAIFHYKLKYMHTSLKDVSLLIRESFPLMLSNASILLYTWMNPILLGFLAGTVAVGYYSSVERIIRAVVTFQGQVGQALYPYFSHKVVSDSLNSSRIIGKVFGVLISFSISVSAFIFIYSYGIVDLVFGEKLLPAVPVLKILSFVIIAIGVSNVLGIQALLPRGNRKQFAISIVIGAVTNIGLAFILVPYMGASGMAVAWLIAEILIAGIQYLAVRGKGWIVISGKMSVRIVLCVLVIIVIAFTTRASGLIYSGVIWFVITGLSVQLFSVVDFRKLSLFPKERYV